MNPLQTQINMLEFPGIFSTKSPSSVKKRGLGEIMAQIILHVEIWQWSRNKINKLHKDFREVFDEFGKFCFYFFTVDDSVIFSWFKTSSFSSICW